MLGKIKLSFQFLGYSSQCQVLGNPMGLVANILNGVTSEHSYQAGDS